MLMVAIAWVYVVLMVAVVDASSPGGSVLGAVMTLLLYGVLPLGIVGYLFFSPARRRVRRAAESAGPTSSGPDLLDGSIARRDGPDPDRGHHAAGDPVAPEGEET